VGVLEEAKTTSQTCLTITLPLASHPALPFPPTKVSPPSPFSHMVVIPTRRACRLHHPKLPGNQGSSADLTGSSTPSPRRGLSLPTLL